MLCANAEVLYENGWDRRNAFGLVNGPDYSIERRSSATTQSQVIATDLGSYTVHVVPRKDGLEPILSRTQLISNLY